MAKTFTGRPIVAGTITGESIVTRQGFNILASYQQSYFNRRKAICSDQNNPDLYGKDLAKKVICLPKAIGSTTGGMMLQLVAELGNGPTALLFSEHIDSLSAAGVILTEMWSNKKIVTVDGLGAEFLSYVQDEMSIKISEDGSVVVEDTV
jgi:predicted aconitase with swiveling domain